MKPSDKTRTAHTRMTQPRAVRKHPQRLDPEEVRLRAVRHAIEDRRIERELGLIDDRTPSTPTP